LAFLKKGFDAELFYGSMSAQRLDFGAKTYTISSSSGPFTQFTLDNVGLKRSSGFELGATLLRVELFFAYYEGEGEDTSITFDNAPTPPATVTTDISWKFTEYQFGFRLPTASFRAGVFEMDLLFGAAYDLITLKADTSYFEIGRTGLGTPGSIDLDTIRLSSFHLSAGLQAGIVLAERFSITTRFEVVTRFGGAQAQQSLLELGLAYRF